LIGTRADNSQKSKNAIAERERILLTSLPPISERIDTDEHGGARQSEIENEPRSHSM
jgi:hypothetical protein